MKKLLLVLLFVPLTYCSSDSGSEATTPPPTTTTPPPVVNYTLTVSSGDGGAVSSTGGTYTSGESVSITATANSEYVFSGWSNGSTDNPLSLTMNSNQTITASFEKVTYTLSTSTEGEGTVTEVLVSSGRTTDYNSGSVVRLTAVPSSGWSFVEWSGGASGVENPIDIDINQPKNISATFEAISEIQSLIFDKWNFNTTTGKKISSESERDFIILKSNNTFILNTNQTERRGNFVITDTQISLGSIGTLTVNDISENSMGVDIDINDFYFEGLIAFSDKNYVDGDCTSFLECVDDKTYSILSNTLYLNMKNLYQDEFFILKFIDNPNQDWINIYNNRKFSKIIKLVEESIDAGVYSGPFPTTLDFSSISYSNSTLEDYDGNNICESDWSLFTNNNKILVSSEEYGNFNIDNYTILKKNEYNKISFSTTNLVGQEFMNYEISLNMDKTLRVSFTNAITNENDFVNSTVFYLKERPIILPPSEIELDGVSYYNICEVNDLFLLEGDYRNEEVFSHSLPNDSEFPNNVNFDSTDIYTPFNIWSIWLCYTGFCNEEIWGGAVRTD
jgi:hypothetical protein